MTELALIAKLAQRLPAIGDDCAILPHGGEDLLFKVDMLVEDVHFRRRGRTAADVGHRALARALSDIAAMGGKPKWALVALALGPWTKPRWVEAFYDGLLALAHQHDVEVVGGDLSHANQLVCDISLTGVVPTGQSLTRSGARPGDHIYVTGPLGRREWRFQPRLAEGHRLRGKATACMDLSDGLALDLHRLCLASQVAAELHHIPVAPGATRHRALHYGEDYELLYTARQPILENAIPIGVIVNGPAGEVRSQGVVVPPRGYDHLDLG